MTKETLEKKSDIVVIGSGPAGSTAAIYGARAGLDVSVFTAEPSPLSWSPRVENFPGFDGPGLSLIQRMEKQAKSFGAKFLREEAVEVNLVDRKVNDIVGGAIIIATGTTPRKLNIKDEERFIGKGVSTCAVCDGMFFKDKDVVVVGGGDTAVEDAKYLSPIVRSVSIVHRGDALRSHVTPSGENIKILLNTEVEEYLGDGVLTGVRLNTGRVLEVSGVFLAIGGDPNTHPFDGQISTTTGGYIEHQNQRTDIWGVYVAGDVCDPMYRQAITAAGQGCMAAMQAINFIRNDS